jgi:hypothetical protein
MQYDIIALQCQGTNVALGQTPEGHEFLAQFEEKPDWDFLEFIQSISINSNLRVGVLDPTGKTLNFGHGVLH